MQLTLLSSKGQVIIPKAMREALHWHAGTRLEVKDTVEGILLTPVQPQQKAPLSQGLAAIRSRIAYNGPIRSVEDMADAILKEAQRRGSR
jgi:AbrB family looped-hinge helix DNA binding protein